jgi:putative spermidine/putrescine transport system ATP-binding protein
MLEIRSVSKSYHGHVALNGITIDVRKGELFSLLGPSGCGKTTLLRAIAGIHDVDHGSIKLNGIELTNRPMYRRNTALVFQNYALFPHMTVAQNVAFGLHMRKVERDQIEQRVEAALQLVRLPSYGERIPAQLSGGQQQRVAIARAIVIEPELLLLDEPLSNLDTHLREEMRDDIRALQKKLGITAVLVTHDIQEALSVSDRVAVMRAGQVEQIGTPSEIYDSPLTRFTAGFVGQPNLIAASVASTNDQHLLLELSEGLHCQSRTDTDWKVKDRGWLMVRPQRVAVLSIDEQRDNVFSAVVDSVTYTGEGFEIRARVNGASVRAIMNNPRHGPPEPGSSVRLGWNVEDSRMCRDD